MFLETWFATQHWVIRWLVQAVILLGPIALIFSSKTALKLVGYFFSAVFLLVYGVLVIQFVVLGLIFFWLVG